MTTIELKTPIEHGEKLIKAIVLKPFNVGAFRVAMPFIERIQKEKRAHGKDFSDEDLAQIAMSESSEMIVKLIIKLSGQPEDVIEQLDGESFRVAREVVTKDMEKFMSA